MTQIYLGPDDVTYVQSDGAGRASMGAVGPKSAAVRRTANQTLATGDLVPLSFDLEVADTGGFFDPTASTKLTMPLAGLYLVTATVYWAAGLGIRQLVAQKNGDIAKQVGVSQITGAAAGYTKLSELIKFAAGDFIEFIAYQNSGSPQDAQVDEENSIIAGIVGPF